MSSVSLTLHQVTSVASAEGGSTFTLASTVTASIGIDRAVFVFRTSSKVFSHYASAADLVALPSSLELAQADGAGFYRQDRLTRTWPTLRAMEDDMALTRARLRSLVDDVGGANHAAIVDEVIVIEAS